jgi:hypothetical protein
MIREEMKESIPPCFTEHVGKQLVAELDRRHS